MTAGPFPPMRGRPLIVLVAMMLSWTGMRFALWPEETLANIEEAAGLLADTLPPSGQAGGSVSAPAPGLRPSLAVPGAFRATPWSAPISGFSPPFAAPRPGPATQPSTNGAHDVPRSIALTLGAFRPPVLAIEGARDEAFPLQRLPDPALTRTEARPDRWSLDSWLLLRPGAQASAAIAPASYGSSQAGMLLRYRLAPGNRFAPTLLARVTGFPDDVAPPELALGAAARPIAGLPLSAQIELRLRERNGRVEARPAALVVGAGERRIAGLDASAYGQAGYVAGSDATGFADGRLTLRKPVLSRGDFRLSAGAGAWGGAQQDAARADIGPSVALALDLPFVTARLEADYRVRVAGSAQPGSGPALTVSASF